MLSGHKTYHVNLETDDNSKTLTEENESKELLQRCG